jgi:hypothetical protein
VALAFLIKWLGKLGIKTTGVWERFYLILSLKQTDVSIETLLRRMPRGFLNFLL